MIALTLRSFFIVKSEEDLKFTSNGQTVCHRKRNCISCAKNYESVFANCASSSYSYDLRLPLRFHLFSEVGQDIGVNVAVRNMRIDVQCNSCGLVAHRRRGLCRILKYLQEFDVHSVSDISYDSLFALLEKMDNGSYYSEPQNREMMNYLLAFLYDRNRVPYGFVLFIPSLKCDGAKLWHFGENKKIKCLQSKQHADTNDIKRTLYELLSCRKILLETHDWYGYSYAEKKVLARACGAL